MEKRGDITDRTPSLRDEPPVPKEKRAAQAPAEDLNERLERQAQKQWRKDKPHG